MSILSFVNIFKPRKSLAFSDDLAGSISDSRHHAIRLKNDFIGSEHFILAVLHRPDSEAYHILDNLLVNPVHLVERLETLIADQRLTANEPLPTGSICITKELEGVFKAMKSRASQQKADAIEAIHCIESILSIAYSATSIISAEFGLSFCSLKATVGTGAEEAEE